jgi:DNA polymerase-3 subunit chi
MTEFQFHHLERRTPEQALPALVEAAFEQRVRVVVEAPDRELVERLDERLWTHSDDSFLPHAIAGQGADDIQPVLLTTGSDNGNRATLRILLAGAKADAYSAAGAAAYDRIVLLFDGSDDAQLAGARAQWTAIKAAGHPVSYWRQGDDGAWARVR